jgi:Domain of unknown function (DUF5666)
MKRVILSAAIASALAVAASAIPQEKPADPAAQPEARQSTSQQAPATSIKGTVASVDQSGKSFVVKDEASGKDVTVYWDSATKVNGDLKPGSMVSLQTTDQGGKMMATSIDIKSAKKPY